MTAKAKPDPAGMGNSAGNAAPVTHQVGPGVTVTRHWHSGMLNADENTDAASVPAPDATPQHELIAHNNSNLHHVRRVQLSHLRVMLTDHGEEGTKPGRLAAPALDHTDGGLNVLVNDFIGELLDHRDGLGNQPSQAREVAVVELMADKDYPLERITIIQHPRDPLGHEVFQIGVNHPDLGDDPKKWAEATDNGQNLNGSIRWRRHRIVGRENLQHAIANALADAWGDRDRYYGPGQAQYNNELHQLAMAADELVENAVHGAYSNQRHINTQPAHRNDSAVPLSEWGPDWSNDPATAPPQQVEQYPALTATPLHPFTRH